MSTSAATAATAVPATEETAAEPEGSPAGQTVPQIHGATMKDRLKAWWDGTALPTSDASGGAAQEDGSDPASDAAPESGSDSDEGSASRQVSWTPVRAAISELIWGAGYIRPGGEARLFELIEPVEFSAGQRVLLLNAGLGGQVRALVERFRIQVDGREAVEVLATGAMERLRTAGVTNMAKVWTYDPDEGEFGDQIYDHVFAPAACFATADKARLLRAIHKSLRPSGDVLITDFLATESAAASAAVETWAGVEPQAGHLSTYADYMKALLDAGFHIKSSEDVTAAYCDGVLKSWAEVNAMTGIKDLPQQAGVVLFDEGCRWVIRASALQGGAVALYRIHAVKPAEPKPVEVRKAAPATDQASASEESRTEKPDDTREGAVDPAESAESAGSDDAADDTAAHGDATTDGDTDAEGASAADSGPAAEGGAAAGDNSDEPGATVASEGEDGTVGEADAPEAGEIEEPVDADTDASADGEAEPPEDGEADVSAGGDADTSAEGETAVSAESEANASGDGEADASGDGEADASGDGEADASGDGEAEADASAVSDVEASEDAVADASADDGTDGEPIADGDVQPDSESAGDTGDARTDDAEGGTDGPTDAGSDSEAEDSQEDEAAVESTGGPDDGPGGEAEAGESGEGSEGSGDGELDVDSRDGAA